LIGDITPTYISDIMPTYKGPNKARFTASKIHFKFEFVFLKATSEQNRYFENFSLTFVLSFIPGLFSSCAAVSAAGV